MTSSLECERVFVPAIGRSPLYPPVDDHDKDAVIRVAAYHDSDLDWYVIRFSAEQRSSIRAVLSSPLPSIATPTSSGSRIDQLPVEIVWKILRDLDVASFFKFRGVNRRAYHIASSLQEYRIIVQYAVQAIMALAETELMPLFTLSDIYSVLLQKDCTICGPINFSTFIFLPTFQRCCNNCLQSHPSFDVHRVPPQHVQPLRTTGAPVLRTIPGVYCPEQQHRPKSQYLSTVPPPPPDTGPEPDYLQPGRAYDVFLAAMTLPHLSFPSSPCSSASSSNTPPIPLVDHGVSCTGCFLASEKYNAVDVSHYSPQPPDPRYFRHRPYEKDLVRSGPTTTGVLNIWERGFSRDRFLEHFRWCKEAQRLWEESENGTKEGDGLPWWVSRDEGGVEGGRFLYLAQAGEHKVP